MKKKKIALQSKRKRQKHTSNKNKILEYYFLFFNLKIMNLLFLFHAISKQEMTAFLEVDFLIILFFDITRLYL